MQVGNYNIIISTSIFLGYSYIQVSYYRKVVLVKPDLIEVYLVDKYDKALEVKESLTDYLNSPPEPISDPVGAIHSLLGSIGLTFDSQSAITLSILKYLGVVSDPVALEKVLNGED